MRKIIPAYIRVLVIFFAVGAALEYFIDSGDRPAFIKYPMILLFLGVFLFLLIAIEIVNDAVDKVTYHLLTDEQKAQLEDAQNISYKDSGWYKNLMQKLTRTVPIDNENQLLLDHDYDGIKELDNTLPPWWVYLFYVTILFAGIYLFRFHVAGGDNQEMELKKEIEQAKVEVEQYMKTAPDMMDEKSVTLLTDAPSLNEGKTIFTTHCAACHRADAGGAIGPNLTDNHWILGGGIKDVFHTIMNGGRDSKGMISWKGTLKPTEMQKVASYILSLKGSNPKDAKAPDGEIWEEKATAKTDSTAVKK